MSSKEFVKNDENGFYYYDRSDEGGRYILFRSIDIAKLLNIARDGTPLEKPYIELHDTLMLAAEDDRSPDLFMYLKSKFQNCTHSHLVLPTDISGANDLWSELI